jgi:aspartyl-tRNA synthetase
MERTLVKDLHQQIGHQVKVQGFVHTIRGQKRIQFVILRDHTGQVQLVHERAEGEDQIGSIIAGLTIESTITVTGKVIENAQVKLGGLEIAIEEFKVESLAQTPLPIMPSKTENAPSLDHRMDYRWLDLRRAEEYLVFEVQTVAEAAMREFWLENGFLEIHSPKLMGAASESGAELFQLKYFDNKMACLAQSPQNYKQMAQAAGFDRVFEIGPVFRANPSFTSRHDTEFTSVDMEFSWIDSHEDIMAMEEAWIIHTFKRVKEQLGEKIKTVFGRDVIVPEAPFPRIPLAEAIKIVAEHGHTIPNDTKDLDPTGEKVLAEYVKEKFGHEFVFVTDYPASVRAFYHMRYPDRPDTTMSFDLLWQGLEVTTGAQREHRYDKLVEQAKEKGIDLGPLQKSYLDFFKFGCPPHGGLGFGLTRMLMIMLGKNNVREVTYLYRGPNRLTP